jgi:hypothetical protein
MPSDLQGKRQSSPHHRLVIPRRVLASFVHYRGEEMGCGDACMMRHPCKGLEALAVGTDFRETDVI